MTIRFLTPWGPYPYSSLVSFDSPTETALVAAKVASTDLTGGVPYIVAAPKYRDLSAAEVGQVQTLVSKAGITYGPAPIPSIGGADASLSQITALSGSPTLTLTTGPNGKPALQVDWAANTSCELSLVPLIGSYYHGDAVLLMHGSYTQGNLNYATLYVSQDDASYTNWVNNLLQYAFVAPLDSFLEQGGANSYWFRKSSNTPAGAPVYPMLVGATKLLLNASALGAGRVYLYGVSFAAPQPKSRICVTWDDGYDSMFKLGYESFAARGIKTTLGVIGSAQDFGGTYSYTRQLRAFVDAGNACVAHGPWPAQGAGNLWSAYGGTGAADAVAKALADMQQNRDWLSANGLLVPGAEKCYVWPQGNYQRSVNDTALLDAALAAGFTTARGVGNLAGASPYSNAGRRFDAQSKYGRMNLPIIGHLWAGTTAAESTNITAVTNAISGLATARGDAFLMLHRVLASNASDGTMGASGNITIRKSDLETIAAAIKTQIDAGTMTSATMPELSMPTWWAQ